MQVYILSTSKMNIQKIVNYCNLLCSGKKFSCYIKQTFVFVHKSNTFTATFSGSVTDKTDIKDISTTSNSFTIATDIARYIFYVFFMSCKNPRDRRELHD